MSLENKTEILVTATGRVQGVGFRRFVQKTAISFNVSGFVKNNADSTVTIKACAPKAILNAFLAAVKKGNFFARVDELIIEEEKKAENECDNEFKIVY